MMARLAVLESFDTAAPPEPGGPGPDWLAGHAAGFDEGQAAARAEASALSAETAQRIADLCFGYAEAEAQILARLRPLFRALADRIVPAVLQDTLGVALAEELDAAVVADLARPAVLRVPPEDHAAVGSALAALARAPFVLRADPALGRGQALIETPVQSTAFDCGRLAADVDAALAALCIEPARNPSHG